VRVGGVERATGPIQTTVTVVTVLDAVGSGHEVTDHEAMGNELTGNVVADRQGSVLAQRPRKGLDKVQSGEQVEVQARALAVVPHRSPIQ